MEIKILQTLPVRAHLSLLEYSTQQQTNEIKTPSSKALVGDIMTSGGKKLSAHNEMQSSL